MNFFHVFILSLIEGVTEFLPISSTGHMILASKLMGLTETNFLKTFEIVIQLGAIMAVVVLYFKKFLVNFDIYKKLFIAFLPTAVVGFLIYPLVKSFLGNTQIVIWSLFLGGVFMILFEKYFKEQKNNGKEHKEIKIKNYFLIGLFQSISMIPGVSRAMMTIYGARIVGLSKSDATEFSFLLAVPIMMAATGYDIWKSRHMIAQGGFLTLFVGTTLAFIFAILAVKFLIGYIKKHDFTAFGVYRIILAILFWIFVK